MLAYLALHPKGAPATKPSALCSPISSPSPRSSQFNTATTNIRKALRTATDLAELKYVLHTAGPYRINPDLIDVDLWQLTTTLMDAEQADDDAERIDALARISDLYTGEFASGLEYEWTNAHREYLRRTVIDAVGRFVQLTQQEQPDRALATLERALTYDPYSEPLYREVMRLQARLGRPDAVRRTYQLLESRLDEIDAEPNEDTHQLMTALSRPTPDVRNGGVGNEAGMTYTRRRTQVSARVQGCWANALRGRWRPPPCSAVRCGGVGPRG